MKKLKTIAPYVLIVVIALLLRSHRYWEFPTKHETADELAWTWLGASILEDGIPTSWSYFHSYSDADYVYKESPVHAPFVRPAVDHPPLFGLIPGIAHNLTEEKWDVLPDHKTIRIPMLLLGTLAVALFGYWTSLVLEKKWSLVATFLYAVVPTFVFSSRLVVSENLIVIWLLILGILLHFWEELPKKKTSQRKKIQVAFFVISTLAVLTKISGVMVPSILFGYSLMRKDRSLIKTGIISLLGSVASLLLYAKLINWELFLAIQGEQAIRPIGLSTLYNRFFVKPNIAQKIFYDGWVILGLFGFIYALIKKEVTKLQPFWLFALLSTIATLGFIGISGGEYTFYGWYSYTLFPFLALFITLLLKEAYAKKYLLSGVLWLFLLPSFDMMLHFTTKTELATKLLIRIVYFAGFVPLLISLTPLKRYARFAQLVLFASVIVAGCITIASADGVAVELLQTEFWAGITQ
jgi:4-amino-4-deoxy-L-arabinose transferase-like glycosyltransferase